MIMAANTPVIEKYYLQFPSEIVEKILSKLDGKSLLISRVVCRQWKAVVDNILKR